MSLKDLKAIWVIILEKINDWSEVSIGDFVYVSWKYLFKGPSKMMSGENWVLFKIVDNKLASKDPKDFMKAGEVIMSSKGSSVTEGKVVGLTQTMVNHVKGMDTKGYYFKYRRLEKWTRSDVALMMV
jgi:hypothetical protein